MIDADDGDTLLLNGFFYNYAKGITSFHLHKIVHQCAPAGTGQHMSQMTINELHSRHVASEVDRQFDHHPLNHTEGFPNARLRATVIPAENG